MAKIATDLEQSKKLAKILPIESADMIYTSLNNSYPWVWEGKPLLHENDVPAWSLSALIDMLPQPLITEEGDEYTLVISKEGKNDYCLLYRDTFEFVIAEELTVNGECLIEACVEMILKLHEQKLL